MANEILGRVDCFTCGERSAVMQTKRKGAHLYTRCSSCGLDQRTGAKVQQKIWNEAEWLGLPPTPPENVIPNKPIESQPKAEQTGAEDFDPTLTDETEQEPVKQASKKGLILVGVLGLAGIIGAVVSA